MSTVPDPTIPTPRHRSTVFQLLRVVAIILSAAAVVSSSVAVGVATYILNRRVDEAAAIAMGVLNGLSSTMLMVSVGEHIADYFPRRPAPDMGTDAPPHQP